VLLRGVQIEEITFMKLCKQGDVRMNIVDNQKSVRGGGDEVESEVGIQGEVKMTVDNMKLKK
jgi:hypothetical protein